jgi:hypothetical protein
VTAVTPVRRVLACLVLAAAPLAAGCQSQQEQYCSAVSDHQRELTDITTGGGSDALIRALPIFEDLQDQAPSDVQDDWQQLVSRIKALDAALRAAGVDPASYDRDHPPSGLSDAERTRIDAAARELGSGTTVAALEALDQEARDVCHTPLTM